MRTGNYAPSLLDEQPRLLCQVTKYLGFDDEVVIMYIEEQLRSGKVDPKLMQLNLQARAKRCSACSFPSIPCPCARCSDSKKLDHRAFWRSTRLAS